jgi:hypothetical protein
VAFPNERRSLSSSPLRLGHFAAKHVSTRYIYLQFFKPIANHKHKGNHFCCVDIYRLQFDIPGTGSWVTAE